MTKIKSKYFIIIVCFISIFCLSVIGSSIENKLHSIKLIDSLSDFHHYIMPTLLGILASWIGYYFWKKKTHELKILKQLKESENNYRCLFENMTDIVCILDNAGNILKVNNSCLKLYEYTEEELLKMNVNDLVYKDDLKNSKKHFKKLEYHGFYNLYEGRIKTKSGKIIWIQVNSTAIIIDGEKVGSQDIIRDITVTKKNELKIINQNKALVATNNSKDKFFSIIAHDLRGPFNSIIGFSELLNKDFDTLSNDKKRSYLNIVLKGINNVYKLLENLLLWSQTQRGTLEFNLKQLNLAQISNTSIKLMELSAVNKSIKISNHIPKTIDLMADEVLLSTVIRNLLSNALKFTPKGGHVELNAKITEEIQHHKYVEISIKDNGVGIPLAFQSDLFTLENKNKTKGTNNENGTGLGLIICKEFVEKHKGKIWVESEPNKGSTFYFTIPLN